MVFMKNVEKWVFLFKESAIVMRELYLLIEF